MIDSSEFESRKGTPALEESGPTSTFPNEQNIDKKIRKTRTEVVEIDWQDKDSLLLDVLRENPPSMFASAASGQISVCCYIGEHYEAFEPFENGRLTGDGSCVYVEISLVEILHQITGNFAEPETYASLREPLKALLAQIEGDYNTNRPNQQ